MATVASLVCVLGLGIIRCTPAAAAANPVGAHSMLQLDDPYSFMQAMFAEAADMHASAIRLDVAPALVFSEPMQPPDFSGLDEVMSLSQQYHLRVVADLLSIPWWIADCQTAMPMSAMTRCGTDDLSDYRSVISQIVSHADPVIRDWEIWNEPDNSEFFTGTPQQYAFMLRTAHDAIKGIDPEANVLLGGISSTAGMAWLGQVFATPGADAAHAFDIAGVHERNGLDGLDADIASWRQFLAGYDFTGPLWVTEHGYPSDPAFQYDPSYRSGQSSQAAYLTASIPTLVDAGASEVFVTERDNLGGQFASEGVLGGNVSDPPPANPQIVEKPAFGAVAALSNCYAMLGRDCPGPGPVAAPASVTMAAARPGSATTSSVSVADPGSSPLKLGHVSVTGSGAPAIIVADDRCSGQILEPNQSCTISLRFAPLMGGAVAAVLSVPSDNGPLDAPVSAVAPSVSSLASPQLPSPTFSPVGGADGVGHVQRVELELRNPLRASVHLAGSSLRGVNARRFRVPSDRCVHTNLKPGGHCAIEILFTPVRPGTDNGVLTLRGDGQPLSVTLRGTAYPPPSVTGLAGSGPDGCAVSPSGGRLQVVTNQPARLRWWLVPSVKRRITTCGGPSLTSVRGGVGATARCRGTASTAGPWSMMRAGGQWGLIGSHRSYSGSFALAANRGPRGIAPGSYELIVQPDDEHGTGSTRAIWLTVT